MFAQVLRFFGYFLESVVESNIENYRVRVRHTDTIRRMSDRKALHSRCSESVSLRPCWQSLLLTQPYQDALLLVRGNRQC
jgi:hypothetical protein